MKVTFKTSMGLFDEVRADLRRRHPFAAERVGFVLVGAALAGEDIILLSRGYETVEDGDYLPNPGVGAMLGSSGIRKAMQAALRTGSGLFHVHMHAHSGWPSFSKVDRRESRRFVPSFFNANPKVPHGVILLSADSVRGQVWLSPTAEPREFYAITWPGRPQRGLLV
jgi:hypothetical protein